MVEPSLKRTWFISLVAGMFAKVLRRSSADGSQNVVDQEDIDDDEDGSGTASDVPASGTVTPGEENASAATGSSRGRAAATTKAGGRRRKAARKK